MDNIKKYKLIGVLNMFDIIPAFVYPVFQSDGDYYFHFTDVISRIEDFSKIEDSELKERIKFLDKYEKSGIKVHDEYKIGDEPVVAFEFDSNTLFVGNINEFKSYIKQINIDDDKLDEIKYTLEMK